MPLLSVHPTAWPEMHLHTIAGHPLCYQSFVLLYSNCFLAQTVLLQQRCPVIFESRSPGARALPTRRVLPPRAGPPIALRVETG